MAESLSSVPPVWPSPRPEIIGTKAPQAATIGASIRLTLSPTPPLECLSITGPGSARLVPFELRAGPHEAERERHPLGRRHAAEEHRHGEGRDLALAQRAVMDAADDEGDLLGR